MKAFEIAFSHSNLIGLYAFLEKHRGCPVALIGDYNDRGWVWPEKLNDSLAVVDDILEKNDANCWLHGVREAFRLPHRFLRKPVAAVNPFLREFILPDHLVGELGEFRTPNETVNTIVVLARLLVPLLVFSTGGGGGDLNFSNDPFVLDVDPLNPGRWAFCPVFFLRDKRLIRTLERYGFVDVTYLACKPLEADWGIFPETLQILKRRYLKTYNNFLALFSKWDELPKPAPDFIARAVRDPWRDLFSTSYRTACRFVKQGILSIPAAIWRIYFDSTDLLLESPVRGEFLAEVFYLRKIYSEGIVAVFKQICRNLIESGFGEHPFVRGAREEGLILDSAEVM